MLLAKETIEIYNKLHEVVETLEPEDDGRNAAIATAMDILMDVLQALRNNLETFENEADLQYNGDYDDE